MNLILTSKSKEDTIFLGEIIGKLAFKGEIIVLKGDLGAGKTTFTKGVGKSLKVKEEINSPTFNILKCYFSSSIPLYHIDAYRLEDVDVENKNIGLEEVIEGDGIALIEWPDFIKEFIPEDVLTISIHIESDDSRTFYMDGEGNYVKILKEVEKRFNKR